jgi:hypothetical protein
MKLGSFYCGGEFLLPKHIKAYVDSFCHEYKEISKETKLIHLGFAVHQGYDLYEKVASYLKDHSYIDESEITCTICRYIVSLRYSEDKHFKDDIDVMHLILCEQLNLRDAIELLVVELNLRFSYNIQGEEVEVTQHYMRWPSIKQLEKEYGEEKTKKIMVKPTGYKDITEDELKKKNLWTELIKNYNQYDLYSETKEHIYPEDYDIIKDFNGKAKGDDYKFVTGVPAEPWQGNPLDAKVIILTLNPGYVEECNKTKALGLPPGYIESIWDEKARTLEFNAWGFLPYESNGYSKKSMIQKDGVKSRADAMNVIGDFYWYDCLRGLNKELKQDECRFFENFALIQYCAYTSKKFEEVPQILPSQEFTKDLIRYITYNKPDTLFVIMRGAKKWEKLLDRDVWCHMQPQLIINKNYRAKQVLSENMLGKDSYNRIIDHIK